MGGALNIVGCGRTGRTLGKLFHDARVFHIKGVLTRSFESASTATGFMGAGEPLQALHEFKPAPVWMIATPDDSIKDTAQKLVISKLIRQGDIVFHLSGALSSEELAVCQEEGASIASVHPIQNFADPAVATGQFAGTWCAVEGDSAGTRLLKQAIEAIGGRPIAIAPHQKTLYHAGAVMGCNYLVALIDVSLDIFRNAGIDRRQGAMLLAPILRATVENILEEGAENAMTGPISRGDVAIIQRHIEALERVSPESASVYRELGRATLAVVERRKELSGKQLDKMRELLADG